MRSGKRTAHDRRLVGLLEITVNAAEACRLARRSRFACLPDPWTLSDFDSPRSSTRGSLPSTVVGTSRDCGTSSIRRASDNAAYEFEDFVVVYDFDHQLLWDRKIDLSSPLWTLKLPNARSL